MKNKLVRNIILSFILGLIITLSSVFLLHKYQDTDDRTSWSRGEYYGIPFVYYKKYESASRISVGYVIDMETNYYAFAGDLLIWSTASFGLIYVVSSRKKNNE